AMRLGSLEEKLFLNTIQATGLIDVPPQNKAVVSGFVGGYIKDTPLLVGDVVKKGQVLVSLENPEFVTLQQNFLETGQQLSFRKTEYERQQQLLAENITSRKNFLRAESEYKTLQAHYDGLEQQLRLLNFSPDKVEKGIISAVSYIYAPISGSITKMNVTKGMYVSPANEILEIIDNDHIHLELRVFEKDIMQLKKGQRIQFTIPEASNKTFEATVYLIGTNIEENRTILVHGHLKEESANNFLTGMFVEANIITDELLKKALPSAAIAQIGDTSYALRLQSKNDNEYVLEKIEVMKGLTFGDYTAIEDTESIGPTDQFLTHGAFTLLSEY
ncbi:MAG: efflux RND transporter periplasmic adaptor subunit, partial [Eudoraea sp.]|nr:efflux RND transporter periplasmic adaptor subunit [Eudoraea sp.]